MSVTRGEPKHVLLMSTDEALANLCREVLREVFGTEWTLVIGADRRELSHCDVCVWDVGVGEIGILHDLDLAELATHFFLVPKNSLAAFQAIAGASDLNVLVKPVTRAGLRALLRDAGEDGSDLRDGIRGSVGALRAERDQMLQFLIHANLKLQKYSQERTNFLARSIHEFRAPLTAVSGYCALALEEALGPLSPELREVLEKMQRSTARMSRITKAMFQLSTGQVGDLLPNLEAADIRQCLDQALNEVAPIIESKQIATSLDIIPPPEGLRFETAELRQALIHLLENACKFTPRSGSIDIKGYPFFWNRRCGSGAPVDPALDRRVRQVNDPNAFRVDIRDSGPGIPASHVARIFEEYTSYSGSEDRSGGGLGLAICRMILQQHQGRIWAESTPQGALFSFVLPVRHSGSGGGAMTNISDSEQPVRTSEDG